MSDRAVVILRGLRCLPLGVALLLAVPSVARANPDLVSSTLDDNGPQTLRSVINNSASGDTIIFDSSLNGQTITLTAPLNIPHSLTISGPGAGALTVDGAGHGTVFDIGAGTGSTVTIAGLSITGGSRSTTGASGGGGIFADTVGTLNLQGDAITDNQTTVTATQTGGGGGVYMNGGDLTISDTTIDDNTATLTGAVDIENGGGGLYSRGGDVTITASTVDDNTVDQSGSTGGGNDGGGGIYMAGGDLELTGTTVNDNTAIVDSSESGSDGGGGIYSKGGDATLSGATIDDNTFELDSSSVGNNGGGGVYAEGGNLTARVSSIDFNTAEVSDLSTGGVDGGGGLVSHSGTLGVGFSSISENFAELDVGGGDNGGGAILDLGGQSVYLTSTFSDNSVSLSFSGTPTAGNGGGAILTFGASQASDLTIAGNSIDSGSGGGVSSGTAAFTLKNTIIADNTAASGANCAGSFSSSGFNLESANTCGLTNTGDLVNTEPDLGELQDNGGSTLTRALPAGSPAVDTGSCTDILGDPLGIDQREVARPQPTGGRCDIGAYELVQSGSAPPPPPPPPPPASPPVTSPGTLSPSSSTAAGFSGTVNPEGQATTVFFQYGIDSRYRPGGGTAVIYDQSTPPQTLPADATPHAVSASASGLVPNALYHVRLVASNATGTTFGPDQTFTTPAGPAPPPPVLGKSVNVKPVSGQVFVLVGTKLVPLTEGEQLPSGSVLDTRAGSLQLTTATGVGHKSQTGVFGGAIFKLTQARGHAGHGLTTLALVEGAFPGAPSYATCKAHKAADATSSAASSKTLQLLRASAHGKFRTSGRYSAATVRGTKWTVADRCDGTLTHDITDSVAVTDFVHHKTIILHAGRSYLAKAPRHR
jgi:hypothetical protein